MKKPMFPRIIVLLLIYGVVFLLLVMIQFTRQGGFTHNVGNFVVAGYYREPSNTGSSLSSNEYFLTKGGSVFFGGTEFRMDDGSGLRLCYENGETKELAPEYMILSEDAAFFRFPGGSGLDFSTRYVDGALELRISGRFGDQVQRLELPYQPLKTSRIREYEEGKVIVTAEGVDYTFAEAILDTKARILTLENGESVVSYRMVPEQKGVVSDDLVLPTALDVQEYETILTRWRDRSFSLWNRIIGTASDEELVNAYLGESVRRGTYKAAVSAVPAVFLSGGQRTFESSVYLGRLDMGLRSIAAYEREKLSRLSRLINEKSQDFLREFHVFEYLGIRNNGPFIDEGTEIVRALDPSDLTLDLTPGILEGWYDWRLYRFSQENPFDRLVDQACFIISTGVKKSPQGDRLFVFSDTVADTEFNIRVGKALVTYGEIAENKTWAGLGRSIILSTLSIIDPSGMLPKTLTISGEGDIAGNTPDRQINSARIYRILVPGSDTYPHAVSVGPGGIWAWTAAPISSVQENNVLDITVSFPVGETHYIMIRGIRPFSKIQLYNIDYRTDPQFERYDSSGWSYSSSEQTLLLKIRHRNPEEHIRIFS
ncbi:MAG: hypothetical protein LBG08_06615 [Spirochaetaceae bacterium]|jgi:hypothetical protein|nr:hypothetical protein [Spirochaetaceae bacterium]